MRVYTRHRQGEHACGRRTGVAPLSTTLARTGHQLVAALALLIRSRRVRAGRPEHFLLYALLAEEKMSFDMVYSLVSLVSYYPIRRLCDHGTGPIANTAFWDRYLVHFIEVTLRGHSFAAIGL